MLTVRPLYFLAAGVLSTAQASRMRSRRHAAASHFQHVSASTAHSLLPAKGHRGARVSLPIWRQAPVGSSVVRAAPERPFCSPTCTNTHRLSGLPFL